MPSYLCNRFQRTTINGSPSDWTEILSGVPQGSNLGPLLFNKFLNYIFLFMTNSNLCNYADDNTLYAISKDLHVVKSNLQVNFAIMQKWFYENYMVLNSGKCHFMLIGNHDELDKISLNGTEIISSNCYKVTV